MDLQSRAMFLGLLLIFINSMFLFASTLPDGNGGYMTFTLDKNNRIDMNNFNQGYLDMNEFLLGPTVDSNEQVSASTQDKGYLSLFLDTLFSTTTTGFALVGSVVGFVGSIFFGFVIWIDIFLNPAWHPGVLYLNLMFKTFFIIVQLFALFYFVKDIFAIGTGSRT